MNLRASRTLFDVAISACVLFLPLIAAGVAIITAHPAGDTPPPAIERATVIAPSALAETDRGILVEKDTSRVPSAVTVVPAEPPTSETDALGSPGQLGASVLPAPETAASMDQVVYLTRQDQLTAVGFAVFSEKDYGFATLDVKETPDQIHGTPPLRSL